ncbi:MAG: hypothetical protein ACXABY_35960, partial [Candidatus Thorarchaeota archaeon]
YMAVLCLVGCTTTQSEYKPQPEPQPVVTQTPELDLLPGCDPTIFDRVTKDLPEKVEDWTPVAKVWCGQMLACGLMKKSQMNECIELFLKSAKEAEKVAANPSAYPAPVDPPPAVATATATVTLGCEDSVEGQANPEMCK